MPKKIFLIGILLLVACLYSFTISDADASNDKTAVEIVKEVGKILGLGDMRSEQVMTVCRKNGSIRQYRLKIWTYGNDKVFVRVIEPQRYKGRQMLRLGDKVWIYFPQVKRYWRVSGKETFMGSDFTYFDVLRLNLIDNYIPQIVEDLPDQYILKLEGKNTKLTYATAKLWVRKGDFQPVRQEYYSISDDLIKSVLYQDYRDFGGGLTRPGMLEVKSALLPKNKTFLEIIYLNRGVKNPAKRFVLANLGG